jgi:trans-aconitate methyltransferase
MEAICNLPRVRTIAEIGVGGGRYVASLQAILGETVELSGYDVSSRQLAFFRELFPDVFSRVHTDILDVTNSSIPGARPDAVYASTVLMHIQREDAYRRALGNFLDSAQSFAVLMDNWQAHSYFRDLTEYVARDPARRLYVYDSGASVAVVVSLNGTELPYPYVPLRDSRILDKYGMSPDS